MRPADADTSIEGNVQVTEADECCNAVRWSALGAAVAVIIGAGVALPSASAAVSTGDRAVFVPIEPCRLFDTRSGSATVGPAGDADRCRRSRTLNRSPVRTGTAPCPTDATAISMNVTTVDGTAASYLTVYPADAAAVPQASNLNWTPGAPPTPNKVDVKLSATGAIGIYNNAGSVNVLADVVGYYADHNHDDRYYTKAEIDADASTTPLRTEVYGPVRDGWEQPALGGQHDHPTTRASPTPHGNGVYGEIPIRIPVGSRLISVDTVVLDTAGPTTYSVDLIKTTITDSGATVSRISATVSSLGGIDWDDSHADHACRRRRSPLPASLVRAEGRRPSTSTSTPSVRSSVTYDTRP